MTTMTTPKPPKGRRWLEIGEILRKRDRWHFLPSIGRWKYTVCEGARVPWGCHHEYSRAIPRKTNRK